MSANPKLSPSFLKELRLLAYNAKDIFFILKEFLITGDTVPSDVADKIYKNFILVLSPIRKKLGAPIWISKRSGYRPKWWEWLHGRSGNSEHTFKGMGAADLTSNKLLELLEILKKDSPFTRICYYPHHGFIHVDYKPNSYEGARRYYEADENGKWEFKEWI